jgi:hypothetical protein
MVRLLFSLESVDSVFSDLVDESIVDFPSRRAKTFWKPCKIKLEKVRLKPARLLASEPTRKGLIYCHHSIPHRSRCSASFGDDPAGSYSAREQNSGIRTSFPTGSRKGALSTAGPKVRITNGLCPINQMRRHLAGVNYFFRRQI